MQRGDGLVAHSNDQGKTVTFIRIDEATKGQLQKLYNISVDQRSGVEVFEQFKAEEKLIAATDDFNDFIKEQNIKIQNAVDSDSLVEPMDVQEKNGPTDSFDLIKFLLEEDNPMGTQQNEDVANLLANVKQCD